MKDIPDILGMKLEDAKALLEKEGLIFNIFETKPPRTPRDIYESSTIRVIKVEEIRNDILVTVCNI